MHEIMSDGAWPKDGHETNRILLAVYLVLKKEKKNNNKCNMQHNKQIEPF